VNLEEIGGEIGLSSHTVKQWISILEASFVLFRLPPYFENFGKRVIKSPKLYFTDVGLASYLEKQRILTTLHTKFCTRHRSSTKLSSLDFLMA